MTCAVWQYVAVRSARSCVPSYKHAARKSSGLSALGTIFSPSAKKRFENINISIFAVRLFCIYARRVHLLRI